MRKQLVKTVLDVMAKDPRVVLFLGDIGVYSFREAFERFPDRVYNIGILEQASVSLAAGLAIEGLIPVFHTIAPFLVERALEQLKVDFGYQGLGGNFVSVGSSYDYSTLGCTHHCPGDVQALGTIPGMEIFVPGHPDEFDLDFKSHYDSGKPTYFRLSERHNKENFIQFKSPFRRYDELCAGRVIAIGPMRDRVVEACQGLDISLDYLRHVGSPDYPYTNYFDRTIVVEPFYEGTMAYNIQRRTLGVSQILSIGVPRRFLTSYGTPEQLDEESGLTTRQIRDRIQRFLGV